mgnify:CR=1 FL=1
MEQEHAVKMVLLGAAGVGKSSILKRFISDDFDTNEQPTLGASFHSKIVQLRDVSFKFQIWDTAGQEKYAPLAVMYYRDAQVVLLVYDITNKESFSVLKTWYDEIIEKGLTNVILFVIGNKTDLAEFEEVDIEKGKAFADSVGAIFKTTSAKNNQGVKEIFEKILEKVSESIGIAYKGRKGTTLMEPKNDSEKRCAC